MPNQLVSEAASDPRLGPGGNNPPNLVQMLAEHLTDTYRLEFEKVVPIADRANDLPEKIETDAQQSAVTAVYLDAKELFDSLDTARKNEKRPYGETVDNAFKPNRLERLERILKVLRDRSDAYARDKLKKQRAEQAAEQARLQAEADEKRKAAEIAAEFGDTDAVIEHAQAVAETQVAAAQLQSETPSVADVARVRGDAGGMSTGKGDWKFEIADYSKVDLNALRPFFTPAEIDKAVRKLVKLQKGQTKVDGVRVFEDVATTFRRS
ncbi:MULTISPECIES: hypothetical protein [unclassified Bradyrhizobium]|uniref:hypothetical protein n=1 Tax=unclassified Bradyrhizobium TaxID=2631580 RepID=UPI00291633C7|nr:MULTISPECIES: hypothetical protein [unclassified Bradyrhizobium]